jgi:hypothetical protein
MSKCPGSFRIKFKNGDEVVFDNVMDFTFLSLDKLHIEDSKGFYRINVNETVYLAFKDAGL